MNGNTTPFKAIIRADRLFHSRNLVCVCMFGGFPPAGNAQQTHQERSNYTACACVCICASACLYIHCTCVHMMKGDLPTHMMINKTVPKCKLLLITPNSDYACILNIMKLLHVQYHTTISILHVHDMYMYMYMYP